MKYGKGLALGTYDLFHVGHLHFLNSASKLCENLIVAIDSDRRVLNYKGHLPVVQENQRAEIIKSLRFVDSVVINHYDWGPKEWIQLGIDLVFIGENWKDDPGWIKKEEQLKEYQVQTIYITPQKGISTTLIINKIIEYYSK